jgi:hypothetical protein
MNFIATVEVNFDAGVGLGVVVGFIFLSLEIFLSTLIQIPQLRGVCIPDNIIYLQPT